MSSLISTTAHFGDITLRKLLFIHQLVLAWGVTLIFAGTCFADYGDAPNAELEEETTIENIADYYPETTNQELAYVYMYARSNNPTSIPCQLLNLKYGDGFPAKYTNVDYPSGVATPTQWANSRFKFNHVQKHHNRKVYYKPVLYGFTPRDVWKERKKKEVGENTLTEKRLEELFIEERNAFVAKYPDGKHVGWFKYRVNYVNEPLYKDPKNPNEVSERHRSWYPNGDYIRLNRFEKLYARADTKVKPIIYNKTKYKGRGASSSVTTTLVHYEICTLAGMKYVKGDYSDLYEAERKRRLRYQLMPDPLPAKTYLTLPDKAPTIMAYWDTIGWLLKDEEEQLATLETTLEIMKMPAYFVPLVGTGLSFQDALECQASGEPHCWSSFAVDAVSDVAMFVKIPGVAAKLVNGTNKILKAAKPLHKAISSIDNAEIFITKLDKFADIALVGSGAANGVLAAFYIKEGKIAEGLIRGFAGTSDVGAFAYLSKGIAFIPLEKIKNAICTKIDDVKRTVKKITSNIDKISGCKIHNRSYYKIGCGLVIPQVSCH